MAEYGRILLVDDEPSICESIQILLEKDGHTVDTALNGEEGLKAFTANEYDMVIHDLRMPGMDGLTLLKKLREIRTDVPIVVLTAYSTWATAVDAMREGAYNYLRKPYEREDLRAMVQRALTQKRLQAEEGSENNLIANFRVIGSMPSLQEILALVRRVALTDSTVVIQGESGTGKELIARLIHMGSPRQGNAFQPVNCGAFTETLLESEVFGHVKGAFTGAIADKKGLLELADGGTLFLDELGEMNLQTQVKLLRVLETHEFVPVGGSKAVHIDTRIVAATNRDLQAMVRSGAFREDLFYRLNVIPIHLPPLRDRKDDIPLLAGHFIAQYNRQFLRNVQGIDEEALGRLVHYNWPGNIRELQNTIQRAVTLCAGEMITPQDIRLTPQTGRAQNVDAPSDATTATASEEPRQIPETGFNLDEHIQSVEAAWIRQALQQTDGNLTQAAKLLGITFRSIRYKVKKLGLDS